MILFLLFIFPFCHDLGSLHLKSVEIPIGEDYYDLRHAALLTFYLSCSCPCHVMTKIPSGPVIAWGLLIYNMAGSMGEKTDVVLATVARL